MRSALTSTGGTLQTESALAMRERTLLWSGVEGRWVLLQTIITARGRRAFNLSYGKRSINGSVTRWIQNISIQRDEPCLTVEFRQETHNETAGVKQDYNRLGNQDSCTVRLSVRTPPFHGGKTSSILVRCAKF